MGLLQVTTALAAAGLLRRPVPAAAAPDATDSARSESGYSGSGSGSGLDRPRNRSIGLIDSDLSGSESTMSDGMGDGVRGSGEGVEVYVDGGVRRGKDIVRALALGATAGAV